MENTESIRPNPSNLSLGVADQVVRTARRLARSSLFAAETLLYSETSQQRRATELERAEHGAWVMENLCALHGIQIVVEGAFPEEPCIVVANHVSYVEPIAILAKIRGIAVAKQELASWPVVGDIMRGLGVLMLDRASPYSGARILRAAGRALDRGASVLVFPEGTTTRGEDVAPFRRGIFGLARIARVPIVPVTVRYDRPDVAWIDDDAFLPHYLRLSRRQRTRVFLDVHEPIRPERTDLDAAGLAELARSIVASRLTRP